MVVPLLTYILHFGSNKIFIHQKQKHWYDETVKLLHEHVKSNDITLLFFFFFFSDLTSLEMFSSIM